MPVRKLFLNFFCLCPLTLWQNSKTTWKYYPDLSSKPFYSQHYVHKLLVIEQYVYNSNMEHFNSFFPSSSGVNAAIWMHYMNAN